MLNLIYILKIIKTTYNNLLTDYEKDIAQRDHICKCNCKTINKLDHEYLKNNGIYKDMNVKIDILKVILYFHIYLKYRI